MAIFFSIDNLVAIGVTTATSTGIIIAFLKLFGQGIFDKLNRDWKEKQEKINRDWKEEQEKEISYLRSNLKKDEEGFFNLLNIYKSSVDEIQKKRIAAATELWDIAMGVEELNPIGVLYSPLTDSHYKSINQNPTIGKLLGMFKDEEEFYNLRIEDSRRAKRLRPFVSDEVWITYHTYQGFISRITGELYSSIRDKKGIPNWKDNAETKKFLTGVFDDSQLEHIYRLPYGSFDFILRYLEESLIIEMNRMFSGEFPIRNQKELFEKIKESEISKSPNFTEIMDKPNLQLLRRGF